MKYSLFILLTFVIGCKSKSPKQQFYIPYMPGIESNDSAFIKNVRERFRIIADQKMKKRYFIVAYHALKDNYHWSIGTFTSIGQMEAESEYVRHADSCVRIKYGWKTRIVILSISELDSTDYSIYNYNNSVGRPTK